MIDLTEIKKNLPMRDVCAHYHINVGRNGKAICPFHSDHHPSMQVYPHDGGFHCFVCGANGSVIDFIQRMENISFGDAIEIAAGMAGISEPVLKKWKKSSSSVNVDKQEALKAQKEYIRLTTRMNTVLRPMAEKLGKLTMEDDITKEIEDFMNEYAETESEIDAINEKLNEYCKRGIL